MLVLTKAWTKCKNVKIEDLPRVHGLRQGVAYISVSESRKNEMKLPPGQQAIRDKCFHPLGKYMEFPKEDVETSKAARFEKIVSQYPVEWVVKTGNCAFT